MVYVGFRSGGVKKAYAGMRYCSQCDLITNHFVYEKSFRPTVMFIAVAKFNKSYLLGCANCEKGYEITSETVDKLNEQSRLIPSHKIFFKMYQDIENALREKSPKSGKSFIDIMVTNLLGDELDKNEVLDHLLNRLGDTYPNNDIRQVYKYFVNAQINNSNFI